MTQAASAEDHLRPGPKGMDTAARRARKWMKCNAESAEDRLPHEGIGMPVGIVTVGQEGAVQRCPLQLRLSLLGCAAKRIFTIGYRLRDCTGDESHRATIETRFHQGE